MMFRSTQAEDDSGSDWDEYTPNVTPRPQDPNTLQSAALLNAPAETVQSSRSPTHSHGQLHSSTHSHHTSHQPHTSQLQYPPQEPQVTRPYSPHPPLTSHKPHQEHTGQDGVGVSDQTPSRHRHHHSPHKSHTSTPSQHTYPLQDIPQVAYDGTLRPPRTLPPIDHTQLATVTLAQDPRPLTPATMNPVFEEQVPNSSTPPGQHHGNRTQPVPHENSGILEFATVSGESARLLLPAQSPPPYSYMGGIAERSDKMSKRCTEEVTSCMRVVSDFIINFTLGLLHFLCFHVSRKLFCGALHILSDTVTKPLIDLCFNELLWPINACLYQLTKALALVMTPIVELVGTLLGHVANMLRAFRLVDLQFNRVQTKPTNV